MVKNFHKIIGKYLALMLAAVISLQAINPAHAQIVFKNEFKIEDNGLDTFIIDSGDDVSGTVKLQFGSSLAQTIAYDTANNWFDFSDDLNLNQNEIKNVALENRTSAPGSPVTGQMYFNTTSDNAFIWDGSAWIDATASDLDDTYDNDSDKILNIDSASGLEFNSTVPSDIIFDMQGSGDVAFQNSGATYATFTNNGELRVDNIQLDGNTLSSTNTNGDITVDPNGTGFVNIGADTNITGNNVVLDSDNTGGNITLQFGQSLAESLLWDNGNSRFTLSNDVRVEGNQSTIGQTFIAADHTAAASTGVLNLGRLGSTWETFTMNSTTGQFELSDDLNVSGRIGVGTTTPSYNFHILDSTSTVTHEFIALDNGTDVATVLVGTQIPNVTAVDADTGSLFLSTGDGRVYTKADDGLTTNWLPSGLSQGVYDAFTGTFGTPGISNKFVTDSDPRLAASSGSFGETSLGTHLDYPSINNSINNTYIYYTRIFLPSDTSVTHFSLYSLQAKTGNWNFGLYSDNAGVPNTKLAEKGTTAGTSPANGFMEFFLGTPYDVTTAGNYWIGFATTEQPKTHTFDGAEDSFIPYRVQTKLATSTALPATAAPNAVGNSINLPYLAAYEN